MKKRMALLMAALFLWLCAAGCGEQVVTRTTAAGEDEIAAARRPIYDPYAEENVYNVPESMEEEQKGTDYGVVDEDVKYFSKTAGDYKYCNVLLPAGYDPKKEYPVLYLLHGWGASYDVHLCEDSYVQYLYGNMLRDKLTVPMVIVSVEMYTDKLKDREKIEEDDATLLAAYNKVVQDIPSDLMPFIEEHYSVRTDRPGTAIMGVSQGGTKTLATGFANLREFGYIGSFAPDPGAVPTDFLKGTIWNDPLLEDGFPAYDANLEPFYLYLAVGEDDPENVEVTKYYGALLTKLDYQNQTDVVKGFEHDADFWSVCFYNFLHKIFRP